jgi:hypothetical protein
MFQKAVIGQGILHKNPRYWQDVAAGHTRNIVEYDDSIEHVQDGNESPNELFRPTYY